ncbi:MULTISPECIES: hypothetical protein [Vibrio harveyi group]|uniref:hypothetical protein n=1 Tax=Vibrio harveyi group TaxID=717610 RepID=UPI0015F67C37|nr:hypothetical protein [Vibrio alginolyticus]HDM8060817.1 hypothetical protein [Vibrio harveyi]
MQTKKPLVVAMPLVALVLTGCMPDAVDYSKVSNIVSDSVAAEFKRQDERLKPAQQTSLNSEIKLLQLKSIEYPRFAAMVAYRMQSEQNGQLTSTDVSALKTKLSELESDLYLQTFYSSLKEASGFTKEVIPLETSNRSGYRIRNAFDMVTSPDSYFAENFPVNGQIVLSEELVPYPECKEGYRPILLHGPLYEVGDSPVEPFEISAKNEVNGWRITFEGYRAITDLACVPEPKEAKDGISKLLGE